MRDCRHCTEPGEVFQEVEEHLRLATGGSSIKSVMTVFRPQRQDEIWGMRFWSAQLVRYVLRLHRREEEKRALSLPSDAEWCLLYFIFIVSLTQWI